MCGSPTPGTVVPKNGLGTGFEPTKEQDPCVHQNLITGYIFYMFGIIYVIIVILDI